MQEHATTYSNESCMNLERFFFSLPKFETRKFIIFLLFVLYKLAASNNNNKKEQISIFGVGCSLILWCPLYIFYQARSACDARWMTDTVVWIKLNIICVCFYIVCVCVVHSQKFVACFSRSSHEKSQIIAMTYHLYYTFCLHLNSNCVPCSVALGPFRASWNHFAWDSFRSFFGAGLLHFFFFPHFDVAWYLNSLYKPFCHANVQCFCVHSNYVNIHKIRHFPYTGGCSIFVLVFFWVYGNFVPACMFSPLSHRGQNKTGKLLFFAIHGHTAKRAHNFDWTECEELWTGIHAFLYG